jgi:uncharacterized membrane protein YkoI
MKLTTRWIRLCTAFTFCVGFASHAAEPPKNIISMDVAQAKVLKKQPGTIKARELEQEQGKWVYSFDIAANDGKIHEIVKSKVESAGEEVKEAEHGG